jgi:hypothetical protein
VELAAFAPEDVASVAFPVVVDPCRLPPDRIQPRARAFDYAVEAISPGRQPIRVVTTFHAAVDAAACADHPLPLASSARAP